MPGVSKKRIAGSKSRLLSVSERVESRKKFLERVRTSSTRLVNQKAVHEAEVKASWRSASTGVGQIDALIRERDAGRAQTAERQGKWMGTGPPCVEAIPPMPTDPQELEGWSSDPNCDLRNAIEFGSGIVGKIGCLIGQGAGQIAKVGRGSVVEGQSRSAMMSDLIEEQSKRRCLSSGAAFTLQS